MYDASSGYVSLYIYSFTRSNLRIPFPKFVLKFSTTTRNFMIAIDDVEMSFMPRDPTGEFNTGSPSSSINKETLIVPTKYVASADPKQLIDNFVDSESPAFVEANYETLESLLRDRRRQMRNNDLRTELEYFSEDYDEEREMEPRSEPARAVTPPLRAASPRVRRRRERVVGFEETQNRGENRVERSSEGGRPSEEA
ncbi:hypothetical protein Tco_1568829 [Tanacetum coccineum]